jgi:hypothetical protein
MDKFIARYISPSNVNTETGISQEKETKNNVSAI